MTPSSEMLMLEAPDASTSCLTVRPPDPITIAFLLASICGAAAVGGSGSK